MQNEFGQEIPDPTPVVIQVPGIGQVSQIDDVKRFIELYMSQKAHEAEMETLEEANDFDVDDDSFPVSPHEYSEQTEAADWEAFQAWKASEGGAGGSPPGSPQQGAGGPLGPAGEDPGGTPTPPQDQ